jgi:hypothetical protein
MALLAGCGIDQGGYDGPSARSTGPETVIVSGPIDAFGSVHVNGLVLDTSRTQVRIDGSAASEADLRLGQMVRAVAQVDGSTVSALSIDYEENVVGPVASVDAGASAFTVLGQRVQVTATTLFDGAQLAGIRDLVVGERVAVSGITLSGNTILATYVARVAPDEPFEITTVVTAVEPAALTFELGGLTIDYSRAAVVELPGGQPSANTVVEVTGSVLDNGVLVADYVRALALLPGTFTAAATALTNADLAVAFAPTTAATSPPTQAAAARFVGVITARSANTLVFRDLEVSVTRATPVDGDRSDLVAGARVMVVGRILATGRIEATDIEIQ